VPSFTLSRRRALAVVGSALVVVVAAAHFVFAPAPISSPGAVPPVGAVTSGDAAPAASGVVVHVVGAVRRPGVYRLREGKRVADAVARAGGLARRADAAAVNLAAPLADGQQVVVPLRGRGAAGARASSAAAGPVHLNTASAEELDALPGVGPVTAQKIVDFREQHGPFGSADELDAVPGIGPARLDDLRKLVVP
jgi:competence protein ComEA